MDDAKFTDDEHALDTGRLLGALCGREGIRAIPVYHADSIDYTPVIRIEIEDQNPLWVRVLPRDED